MSFSLTTSPLDVFTTIKLFFNPFKNSLFIKFVVLGVS